MDGLSEAYDSEVLATEECYVKQARDHYGSAVRDNRRVELISLGKDVDDLNFSDIEIIDYRSEGFIKIPVSQ